MKVLQGIRVKQMDNSNSDSGTYQGTSELKNQSGYIVFKYIILHSNRETEASIVFIGRPCKSS